MSGRSCTASTTLAALWVVASIGVVLHWDHAEVSSPHSRLTQLVSTDSFELSCRDLMQQGPDISLWDVAKYPINLLSFCLLAVLQLLVLSSCNVRLNKQGDIGFRSDKGHVKWLHGWSGALQTYCSVLFLLLVFTACSCFYNAPVMEILKYALGVFAGYLALVYGSVLLLMFLVYPIFAKLKWFHLERAIIFCISLPDGRSTPISEYIIFPYICYWLYLLYGLIGKSKADFNESTIHYQAPFEVAGKRFPLTKGQVSVGFAAQDLVTDMWVFVLNLYLMPGWWSALWFISLLLTSFVVWHVVYLGGRWEKIAVKAKTIEDVSQFILAIINAVIAMMHGLEFNEYTIFAGIASLLGALTSSKKWYVGVGVEVDQEELLN